MIDFESESETDSLDQPHILDRINPFVGDFELCNSADLIHAQIATYHTEEKEKMKSHHI